jgi:membrane-associated phospholipid phosphatase
MNRKKLLTLLASLLFLAISGQLFVRFLLYHQENINKSGYAFNDSVLDLFPRGDFSIYIFGITYSSLLIYLIIRCSKINNLSKFAMAYGLILLTRIITLSLVPLREPIGLVSLNDPILYNLIFDGEVTADLFYSGHTAFVFVMFFLSKKYIFLILGVAVGVLLMMQRVHYSIDIAAAIPFAYLIAKGVTWTFKKMGLENN